VPRCQARHCHDGSARTAAVAPAPQLTDRFFAAAAFANDLHGGDRRPGTQIPFAAHLMIVAGLVLEDGGDETQAIAALLHDAVEDGGGRPLLERIRGRFGDEVAEIVEACSDSLDPDDPRGWRGRKAAHLEHLRDISDVAILRVALADKVHNAHSIVRDYRQEGHVLWQIVADYLNVEVKDGWVTLTGDVDHQYQSDKAFDHVASLYGVTGITNQIDVVEQL
jgi:(p)ppGpp synthase/HD superfamily hydrolase